MKLSIPFALCAFAISTWTSLTQAAHPYADEGVVATADWFPGTDEPTGTLPEDTEMTDTNSEQNKPTNSSGNSNGSAPNDVGPPSSTPRPYQNPPSESSSSAKQSPFQKYKNTSRK